MKCIEIENLKDIKKLRFDIPEKYGIYLIAGANGCGKTTLLVCLDRICNNMAFANGFSKTSSWEAADQYENASIKYIVDGKAVRYKKAEARWAPTPRKGSDDILSRFGITTSKFIRADSKRIDVINDDLRAGNFAAVDSSIKDALNSIFETHKYDKLQRLKNTNGRGKNSTFFYVIREGSGANTKYYSEKRFSTGELAMVRLVEQVQNVENGAMILLDEAELALHPRVQVKLLEYLRKMATEKELWIFISTHSPTMLKASDKNEILLLRKEANVTDVITPCFPAQAIGDIDFASSNIFDYIFFVEDEKAQMILRSMRKKFVLSKPQFGTALCDIIPVGGFYETARMAVMTEKRIFGNSKVYAVVDGDAFDDLDRKPKFKELLNDRNKAKLVKNLTFTPEVWLIEKIENASTELNRKFLNDYNVEISEMIGSEEYKKCNKTAIRELSKDKWNVIVDYLNLTSGVKEIEIIQSLIDTVSEGEIMSVMGPLFN